MQQLYCFRTGNLQATAKELDDAIKNNIQDIETLDYIADRFVRHDAWIIR